MSSQRWKAYERRVARFFGSERVRGSGSGIRNRDNVEETASDSHHDELFIEVKSAIGPGGTNGWLHRWLRRQGWPRDMRRVDGYYLYLVHTDTLEPHALYQVFTTLDWPDAGQGLWEQTRELAAQEKKVPLLALCVKDKRGFWVVGNADSILEAQKARKETVEHGENVDCC